MGTRMILETHLVDQSGVAERLAEMKTRMVPEVNSMLALYEVHTVTAVSKPVMEFTDGTEITVVKEEYAPVPKMIPVIGLCGALVCLAVGALACLTKRYRNMLESQPERIQFVI